MRERVARRLRIVSYELSMFKPLFALIGCTLWVILDTTFVVFGSILIWQTTLLIPPLFFLTNSWLFFLLRKKEVRQLLALAFHPSEWKKQTEREREEIYKELAKTKHI